MIDELLLKRADFVLGIILMIISLVIGFLKDRIWPPHPNNTHSVNAVTINQVIQYLTPPPPRPEADRPQSNNNNGEWLLAIIIGVIATFFFIFQQWIMIALMLTPIIVLAFFIGLLISRLTNGYLNISWLILLVLCGTFIYVDFLIVSGSFKPDYHPEDFHLANQVFHDYGWGGLWRSYGGLGIIWFIFYILGIVSFFRVNLLTTKATRLYFKASNQIIAGANQNIYARLMLRQTPKNLLIEVVILLLVAYFLTTGLFIEYFLFDMKADINWAINRLINGTKG